MPIDAKFIPILVAVLTLIFGGGFVYNQYAQPDIVYQKLPPYKVSPDTTVTCVLLKNIGHNTAHEVLFGVSSDDVFSNVLIDSPELYEYKKDWQNCSEFKLWFQRITRGSLITVHLTLPSEHPRFDVSLTYEEGAGRELVSETKGVSEYLLLIIIVMVYAIVYMQYFVLKRRR